MLKSRIVCFFTLLMAGLFHIFYIGYFSWFLLLFVLACLLASFFIALPGAIILKAKLNVDAADVEKGQPLTFTLNCTGVLPFACIGATLVCENLFTGEIKRENLRKIVSRKNPQIQWVFTPEHCGIIRCEIKKMKVYDLLGVFSRKIRNTLTVSSICLPREVQLSSKIDLEAPVELRAQKKISARSPYGNYDLREYRPGDPVRSIHWKASAKTDDIFVKEFIEDANSQILLLACFSLDAGEADLLLENMSAFARDIFSRTLPFHIMWEQNGGELRLSKVDSSTGFFRFLQELLSKPLTPSATESFELAVQDNFYQKRLFQPLKEGILDVNRDVLVEGGEG